MWLDKQYVGAGSGAGKAFGDGYGNGNGYGYGNGYGDGNGNGDGYGNGYGNGNGYGYGDGDGDGNGDGYGDGYGDGDGNGDGNGYGNGYGNGKLLAFGRCYKLTDKNMGTSRGFTWKLGENVAQGPLLTGLHDCPNASGDGLCVGWTRKGLTSGGLSFDPARSRLFLAEIDSSDALGGHQEKTRARRVTLVREATAEEWGEVPD